MRDYVQRLDAMRQAERRLGASPDNAGRLFDFANRTAELALHCGLDPDHAGECGSLMDQAIAAYRKLLTSDPHDGAVLTNLGAALSDRGRHCEAVEVLRQAILHSPTDRNAHFNLAVALMGTGAAGRREAERHLYQAALLESGAQTREAYFDPQAQ